MPQAAIPTKHECLIIAADQLRMAATLFGDGAMGRALTGIGFLMLADRLPETKAVAEEE